MIIDTSESTSFVVISIDGREIRLDWWELVKLGKDGKLNDLPGVMQGTWARSNAELDKHEGYDSVVSWLESCGLPVRNFNWLNVNLGK